MEPVSVNYLLLSLCILCDFFFPAENDPFTYPLSKYPLKNPQLICQYLCESLPAQAELGDFFLVAPTSLMILSWFCVCSPLPLVCQFLTRRDHVLCLYDSLVPGCNTHFINYWRRIIEGKTGREILLRCQTNSKQMNEDVLTMEIHLLDNIFRDS